MNELNVDELHVIYVCMGVGGRKPGSFTTSLIETIMLADLTNQEKLKQVFPGLVAAVQSYQNSDLWERWMISVKKVCECKFPGFDADSPTICPTCHRPHRQAEK